MTYSFKKSQPKWIGEKPLSLLLASLMLFVGPGCPKLTPRLENDDFYSKFEDFAAFQKQRAIEMEAAIKDSNDSLRLFQDRLDGIDNLDARLPEPADGQTAYDAFVSLYEAKSGKSWESTSKQLESALAKLDKELPRVPKLDDSLIKRLKSKVGDKLNKRDLDRLTEAVDKFKEKASDLLGKIELIKDALAPLRKQTSGLLSEIELLRERGADAQDLVGNLVDERIPDIFNELQNFENGQPGMNALAEETAQLADKLKDLKKDVGSAIATILEKVNDLPADIKEGLEKYKKDVDQFMTDTQETMAAITATGAMLEQLLPVLAANPWAAAAVAAVLIILALIKGIGDGDENGSSDPSVYGGEDSDSNPFKPNPAQNDAIPDKVGDQSVEPTATVQNPVRNQKSKLGGGEGQPFEAGFRNGDSRSGDYEFILHEASGSVTTLKIPRGIPEYQEFFVQIVEVEDGKRNANIRSINNTNGSYTVTLSGMGGDNQTVTLMWAAGNYDTLQNIQGY